MAYTADLTKRYDNPAIRHRTAQIANDGSQKLPQRVISAALDRLEAGGPIHHLMLAPAAWLAAAEARGQVLPARHFTDPLDAALADVFTSSTNAMEIVHAAFDAAGFAARSPHRQELADITAGHLDSLRRNGAEATLKELLT